MERKQAEDDFLAGLDGDAQDPFEPSQNDDIFGDEPIVEEKEVDAKSTPYHQDKKLQRYIDKEVGKRLKDFKPTATETFVKEASGGDEKIISALTRLVGNDTDEKRAVLNDLKDAFGDLKGQAKKEAIQEFLDSQNNQSEQYERDVADAEDEIEEGFEDIENEYNVTLTDRQKSAFKDFLLKFEPRGGYEEYPDFVETFEVFKNYVKANRPSNSQAKAIASRGMERSSSSQQATPVIKRDGTKSLWQTLDSIL